MFGVYPGWLAILLAIDPKLVGGSPQTSWLYRERIGWDGSKLGKMVPGRIQYVLPSLGNDSIDAIFEAAINRAGDTNSELPVLRCINGIGGQADLGDVKLLKNFQYVHHGLIFGSIATLHDDG